ncbi:hypothetical protein CRYUN_Cryun24cG0127600 [Craigia yunnanensis]
MAWEQVVKELLPHLTVGELMQDLVAMSSYLSEDNVDLVTSIKAASFYRHGKYIVYVSDYMPPSPYKFKKIYESNRLVLVVTSPVMLSTLKAVQLRTDADGEVSNQDVHLPGVLPKLAGRF